jgi:hypothetical protein
VGVLAGRGGGGGGASVDGGVGPGLVEWVAPVLTLAGAAKLDCCCVCCGDGTGFVGSLGLVTDGVTVRGLLGELGVDAALEGEGPRMSSSRSTLRNRS